MIEVILTNNSISIKGHANYAEPGKDIVCAGVSTLVQTLIQSVEELTTDKIQYDMKPGDGSVLSAGNNPESTLLTVVGYDYDKSLIRVGRLEQQFSADGQIRMYIGIEY